MRHQPRSRFAPAATIEADYLTLLEAACPKLQCEAVAELFSGLRPSEVAAFCDRPGEIGRRCEAILAREPLLDREEQYELQASDVAAFRRIVPEILSRMGLGRRKLRLV